MSTEQREMIDAIVRRSAFLATGLASQVARRTHAKVFSVDFRLAPEHPIRPRLTTRSRPMKPSCRPASPQSTSPSRESLPASPHR